MKHSLLIGLWLLIPVLPVIASEDVEMFSPANKCLACHNRLATDTEEDISIGTWWQASMMGNSARDPYWQASVRREVLEHPESAEMIEDTCASCHMPMSRYEAKQRGEKGRVFAHLPIGTDDSEESLLAADGVSCNLCHQISDAHFGDRESFNAGFTIAGETDRGKRPSYGPYPPTEKAVRVMERLTDYTPVESPHLAESEMCATCHTLYTPTLDKDGNVVGELPEQMPYLEWRHSDFVDRQSCQSCHMPVVEEDVKIAIGAEPRPGFSRHQFRGGNAFMLTMLGRYADELGVTADPQDLERAAMITRDHLATSSARVALGDVEISEGRLRASITVENLGGHKLPTAYPSRRAWLHVVIRDRSGTVVFESGRLNRNGSIAGNDNDEDPAKYEPHYEVLEDPAAVQIYEPILIDGDGAVTTALLRAIRYAKDNRLLPRGFDKATAGDDIAVRGTASDDDDFAGGSDVIRLDVPVDGSTGPFTVDVELMYQPIGFRWARNLELQKAEEIDRFVRMFDEMANESAELLAKASGSTSN